MLKYLIKYHHLQQLIMLSWIMVLLIIIGSCQEENKVKSNDMDYEFGQLATIQEEIESRSSKNHHFQLKLSRLFEHSIKHNEPNLTIDDISLLPSISVPYKDNIYYSMLLKKRENVYTLRGDLVFQQSHYRTLISSVRNQHTYFAEFLMNSTIRISKLKITNKKIQTQAQTSISLKENSHKNMDFFVVASSSTNKYYIFASSAEKTITFFEKNGTLIKTILTNSEIKSIKKISNSLVVLTKNQLFYLNINKNFNKTSCIVPYEQMQYFESDESNLKYVYGINNDSIYQFELYSNCRPTNRFYILPNSTFTVVGELIFLSTPTIRYCINKTNSQTHLYEFPFGECLGSKKIEINRKIQNNYIVSQICLGENQINMTHLLIELEDTTNQVTDFSKFRIPLLFFSFGIIIYVTVKNKNKNKPQEEDEKAIQQSILKKLANIQGQNLTQTAQKQENKPKPQPIFEKKSKKN